MPSKVVATTDIKPDYSTYIYYTKEGHVCSSVRGRKGSGRILERNVFTRREGYAYYLKPVNGRLVVKEMSMAEMRKKGRATRKKKSAARKTAAKSKTASKPKRKVARRKVAKRATSRK